MLSLLSENQGDLELFVKISNSLVSKYLDGQIVLISICLLRFSFKFIKGNKYQFIQDWSGRVQVQETGLQSCYDTGQLVIWTVRQQEQEAEG